VAAEPVWKPNPEDGTLELIDPETGQVFAREKRNPKALALGKGKNAFIHQNERMHFVMDAQGRKVWCPKGTNPDQLPRIVYPYSEITCDHVCDLISQGSTMDEIGKMEGMPPSRILWKWMQKYPEFRRDVKEARKIRAEVFHDKAIATAKGSKESRVQSDRLKVDTYKWAAEVNDRETYGKQTKLTGDPEKPIGFLLDTGIRRDPDTGQFAAKPDIEVPSVPIKPEEES
jgi:hypothetical protein